MAEQTELDRREEATPYKREQARERGSVAKSPDLLAVGTFAVATAVCFALGDRALADLSARLVRLFSMPPSQLNDVPFAANVLGELAGAALSVLAPLLFLLVCVAVVANIAQTGPVFSTHPIKPDWQRVHPVAGFKRFFSPRILFELVKNLIRLAVMCAVIWVALRNLLPALFALLNIHPRQHALLLVDFTGGLMAKLLIVLALVAAVDLLFVRWDYSRKLRMSRREITEEVKQREGDPRVRQRMRELRQQMVAKARSLRNVRDADVVVTNPTRVAVAIRYRHGEETAPRVLAKGTGDMARRIRELAARHGVPVVHSPRLARALYRQVEPNQYVPPEWFSLLARILVWVSRARGSAQGPAAPPRDASSASAGPLPAAGGLA